MYAHRVIQKQISLGLASLGVLASISIYSPLFDPFAAAKTFVIICGASLLSGYAAFDFFTKRVKKIINTKKYFLTLISSFAILFFIRSLTTSDINGAFFGVVGRHSGFLVYMAYSLIFILSIFFLNLKNFELIFSGVLIAGFLCAFFSLLEYLNVTPLKMTKIYEGTSGLLGNPNFSGAFMALTSIVAIWFLTNHYSLSTTALAYISLPLSLFGIYTSKALQGFISLAIGLSILIFVWLLNKKKNFVFLALIPIGFISLLFTLGSLQIGPLSKVAYKSSVSERGDMWRAAFAMIKENPFFGVGIERYGFYFRQYRDLKQALRSGPDVFSDNAHNVVLNLMATGGIPLGTLYLIIVISIFIYGVRGLFTLEQRRQHLLAGALALWLPIQAQNAISVDNPGVFVWSWILGGGIIGLVAGKEGIGEDKKERRGKHVLPSHVQVHPLALPVGIFCFLLTVSFMVKPLIAQRSFAFAFFVGVDLSIPETLDNKVAALIRAENQDSRNMTWPRLSANSLFNDKAWEQTIDAAQRAVTKDPEDWISWWFMASAYEESGDRIAGIPARMRTVQLDPWNTSALLELARDQKVAGDKIGFEKSKAQILKINPNGADALVVTSL